MDYEAYLDAFKEELNRKPAGFGPPPAAGGIGGSKRGPRPSSQSQSISEERKQAMQDLHADGLNVKAMSQDDRIQFIAGELKNIAATNDQIANEIQTMLESPRFDMEAEIKENATGIMDFLNLGHAKQVVKVALLAAATVVVVDNRSTLLSLVQTIKG